MDSAIQLSKNWGQESRSFSGETNITEMHFNNNREKNEATT